MSFLFFVCIGFGLYVYMKFDSLNRKVSRLSDQVLFLEEQLRRLHTKIVNQLPGFLDQGTPKPSTLAPEPPRFTAPVAPLPPSPPPSPTLRGEREKERETVAFRLSPQGVGEAGRRPGEGGKPFVPSPNIDWEKFMGVQLFAWLGGFALFLGMAFFVKYSIDHNLISPLMRVMIGFVAGVSVIVAGLALRSKGYAVTVQTLCAAGVSILYADIYACRSFYQFLSPEAAFPLMILVTVVSFLLAVRLDSRYVAILGLVGGFLTPVLLSTGVDRPIALFSYIALLDVGVIAVAIKKRWGFLIGMSAAATFLMEVGWTAKFLTPAKGEIAFGVYALFGLAYLLAAEAVPSPDHEDPVFYVPGALMPLASMGLVGYMLSFNALAARPGLVLTLLLVLSLQLAYAAVRFDGARPFYMLGGGAAFMLLAWWTAGYLKTDLLLWGLGFYLAFAVVHAALPFILQQVRPQSGQRLLGGAFIAPILMLALMLMAMVFCDILSFVMWPFVFLIGMIAIAVAWVAGSILAAAATLLVIMASFGVWLFRLPDVAGLPGILGLLAFFVCAFFAWGLLVTRKASLFPGNAALSKAHQRLGEEAAQLPAMTAFLPFFLIAMVCVKLKMPDPSQPFTLMMLMVVLLLGLARYRKIESVSVVALLSVTFVEYAWHMRNFSPHQPWVGLGWYLAFYAVFTVFPFLFHKHLKTTLPWTAAALAGPVHFWMVYNATTQTVGKGSIGAVPALFGALSIFSLYRIIAAFPKTDPRRNSLLAWFGGVALFFITLVIPIQFDKEWITLGWALEGAALLWLYRRVPHEGLKGWGISLLVVAFVRLALNPAVLSYHPRTATPLFNWYLFVYGTAVVCCYAGALWLKAPRNKWMETDIPPVLNSLGTVLLFLLLNIQVADYFSTGGTITFNFSSGFAQDMTYSLTWALFAIGVLVAGIRTKSQGARYASLGLLMLTIVKVFLHDLWRLGQLFRVASFVGLAVVLILVSFLYQKFIGQEKPTEVRRA